MNTDVMPTSVEPTSKTRVRIVEKEEVINEIDKYDFITNKEEMRELGRILHKCVGGKLLIVDSNYTFTPVGCNKTRKGCPEGKFEIEWKGTTYIRTDDEDLENEVGEDKYRLSEEIAAVLLNIEELTKEHPMLCMYKNGLSVVFSKKHLFCLSRPEIVKNTKVLCNYEDAVSKLHKVIVFYNLSNKVDDSNIAIGFIKAENDSLDYYASAFIMKE